MEFGNFIEQFAEISGVEMPEIVDDAAAFDADGMPFFLMRVANEGESAHVVNFTGEDPITIHQPSNTGDSRSTSRATPATRGMNCKSTTRKRQPPSPSRRTTR